MAFVGEVLMRLSVVLGALSNVKIFLGACFDLCSHSRRGKHPCRGA